MKKSNRKKLYVNAIESKISMVVLSKENVKYYPFYISYNAKGTMLEVPSPLHGRSIIAGFDKKAKRFVITKGNGLTYFPYGFVLTKEMEGHAWGFLRHQDAIRDYNTGLYIADLGILTNEMEAVYTLEDISAKSFEGIVPLSPTILQYKVLCPYRLSDMQYLPSATIKKYLKLWRTYSDEQDYHCIAADVFLKNQRIMREKDVLHNAIHNQNYTLALELLDFELSRSPITPYENPEDEKNYPNLRNREILQSLEIVNYVAFQLGENLNYSRLKELMLKHGFGELL